MELRFVAMLYSNLGNGDCNAGHTKCFRGPQVPHPGLEMLLVIYNKIFRTNIRVFCNHVNKTFFSVLINLRAR